MGAEPSFRPGCHDRPESEGSLPRLEMPAPTAAMTLQAQASDAASADDDASKVMQAASERIRRKSQALVGDESCVASFPLQGLIQRYMSWATQAFSSQRNDQFRVAELRDVA